MEGGGNGADGRRGMVFRNDGRQMGIRKRRRFILILGMVVTAVFGSHCHTDDFAEGHRIPAECFRFHCRAYIGQIPGGSLQCASRLYGAVLV